MKASLCLEAAERPQGPRLYSSSRPRFCDRMPSLVCDRGPVLRVLGWALTRMRNLSLVYYDAEEKEAEECLCVEQWRSHAGARWGTCPSNWWPCSTGAALIVALLIANRALNGLEIERRSIVVYNTELRVVCAHHTRVCRK